MNTSWMWRKLAPYIQPVLLYFGCFGGSSLWLIWLHLSGQSPPISFSIGIAVAGMLLGGLQRWPAVALGVFSAFLLFGPPRPFLNELIAICALTLGAMSTSWLIRRAKIEPSDLLEPHALFHVLAAALVGALAAATIGTASASANAAVGIEREFMERVLRFGLGIMIAAPLVLVWAAKPDWRWQPKDWFGFAVAILFTGLSAAWAFLDVNSGPIAWLVYPPLIVSALVYHLRGATTSVALASLIILWGTDLGSGPFALAAPQSRILLAQGFVAITCASMLLLAAFADKRKLDVQRRVAEQRYRAVFEQRGVAVALLSLDGVYLDMNERGLEICGYSREELVGADYRLLEPDADGHVRRVTADVIDGTLSSHSEDRTIITKSGEPRILNVTINTVRKPNGTPDHLMTVAKDITARVRATDALAESEMRLRLAQEAAGVGVWEIDLSSGLIHHSTESAVLFGQDAHDVDFGIDELKPVIGATQVVALTRAIDTVARERGIFEMPLQFLDAHGRDRWVRLHGRYDAHHGQPRLLGLAMDVTRDYEAEARLREAHDGLLRVARLSAMGAMASTLAHELNQPLSALSNYLGTCRYIAKRRPEPDQVELDALDMAAKQALRAGGIIRKIRAFAQSGEIEPELVDIAAVIHSAFSSVQLLNVAKGVTFDFDFDTEASTLLGDRLQLEQVVANLVRNAAEATKNLADRWVRVSTKVEAAEVIVAVADSGCGLSNAMVENLFEPFRTTKDTGTGLGLPICRTIIEAHGGKLWAENGPNGGAIFRFTVPRVNAFENQFA